MHWNWKTAVTRQHRSLRWVVMMMFSMAGLVSGAVVETLPRQVHRTILHYLRPAEAAARRLIAMAIRAEDETPLPFTWTRPEPKRRREKAKRRAAERNASPPDFVPAFPLFDPRKDVDPKPKRGSGRGPGIWFFDGFDQRPADKSAPMPDDPVSARRLCLRLLSLKAALDDLAGQARRLKRVLARATRKWPEPMRRGRPPGYRAGGKDFIDEILAECQTMAEWALKPPDTS